MTDEQQIAVLREEIRRAGSRTAGLRDGLRLSVAGVFVLLFLLTPVFPGALLWAACATGVYWIVLAPPIVTAYRVARRLQIRRKVAVLPGATRAQLLQSLRGETGDAAKIVSPLAREFHVAAELSPSAAPDVRGDEASPAERAREPIKTRRR